VTGVRNPPDAVRGAGALAQVTLALGAGGTPTAEDLRDAVKYTLYLLTGHHPGHAVEVRIPPIAAVGILPGPRHRRGTPPAVVETDPMTWCALAVGLRTWSAAVADGSVRASGARSDLSGLLPLAMMP